MACIDFTDLVVDDTIALEGLQNFTICVGGSASWVVIVDDDSEEINKHTYLLQNVRRALQCQQKMKILVKAVEA